MVEVLAGQQRLVRALGGQQGAGSNALTIAEVTRSLHQFACDPVMTRRGHRVVGHAKGLGRVGPDADDVTQRLGRGSGLTAAARSVAFDGTGLSGDWCDLRPQATGEAVVVVADVVGCGTAASAAKRKLRPALRELAMRREQPSLVLEALDGVASQTGAGMATMIYGVIDPPNGRVELFNAGHPPPLGVDPEGVASYLECDHFPPLGSGLCRGVTSSACYLQPGSTLILYTDGLVERRGEDLNDGLRLLQELATGVHGRSVDDICDLLLDARLSSEGVEDDITVLVLRLGKADS